MKTLLIFFICCGSIFLILTVGTKKKYRRSGLERNEKGLQANLKEKNAPKRKKISQNHSENFNKRNLSKKRNNTKRKKSTAKKQNIVQNANKVKRRKKDKNGDKVRRSSKAKNRNKIKKGNKVRGNNANKGNAGTARNQYKRRNNLKKVKQIKKGNNFMRGKKGRKKNKLEYRRKGKNGNKDKYRGKRKNGNKTKNRSKKRNRKKKKRNKKNKSKKEKNISTKEWYSIKKGKMKNINIAENLDTTSLNGSPPFGIVKPGWTIKKNSLSKTSEIKFETELQNLAASTIIRLFESGEIEVNETIRNLTDGKEKPYYVSFISKRFARCYNTMKHCVAITYDSTCLKDLFTEAATKVIGSSSVTMDGDPCDYWNTTGRIRNGFYVNNYGNRCVTSDAVDFFNKAPRCWSEDGLHLCFPYCNPDVNIFVVGPDSAHIELLQAYGRKMQISYDIGGKITVQGESAKGNHDETFYRCYNYGETCISKVDGTCLEDYYSDAVLKVLQNANRTATFKPCLRWDITIRDYWGYDLTQNLCAMPKDSGYNDHGPWCMTSTGWESCYKECNVYNKPNPYRLTPTGGIDQAGIDSDLTLPPYQPLSPVNRRIKMKVTSQRGNEPKYFVLYWHDNGIIKVLEFTKHYSIEDPGYTSFERAREYDIKRCFNQIKRCIAKWNGQCLKDIFKDRDVLNILLEKTYTDESFKCQMWNQYIVPEMPTPMHNKCLLDHAKMTFYEPTCRVLGLGHRCYPHCKIDVAKTVLDRNIPDINLIQSMEYHIIVRLVRAPDTFEISGGCFDETITRCYDTEKKCVAAFSGTCLTARYPDDVATILSNKNVDKFGQECHHWNAIQTSRRRYSLIEDHNLCLPSRSRLDYGPECHGSYNIYLPCFQSCELLGSHGPATEDLWCTGKCAKYIYTSCHLERGVSVELMQKMAALEGCRLQINLYGPCLNKTAT